MLIEGFLPMYFVEEEVIGKQAAKGAAKQRSESESQGDDSSQVSIYVSYITASCACWAVLLFSHYLMHKAYFKLCHEYDESVI